LEKKIQNYPQKSLVSSIIFLATIVLVSFTLISVIFPALILRTFGGFEDNVGINPFELGVWAYPFLITNLVILVFGILYFKKMLPNQITKTIRFICNFEVSSQIAFVIITILIGVYVIFSVGDLFDGFYEDDYSLRVKERIDNFDFVDSLTISNYNIYADSMLGYVSLKIFDNVKVLPFIGSISLLVVTYYLTKQITKKRFPGIVAICIILQSGIFLKYDTSITYPNIWVLSYLVSLYAVVRISALSPIFYLYSILSKPLTVAFFPMSLFFVYRSNISKRKKITILISYGIIITSLAMGLFFVADKSIIPASHFDEHDFWGGFTVFNSEFRYDGLISILLLPLVIGLFLAFRRGIEHADSITFMIMSMILSAPLLVAVSNIINMPYRFVPLVVFFAIGVGILLSKPNQKNSL